MSGRGTKEISVFVDESGSFDGNSKSSQYYLICMVFHDQNMSITDDIAAFNQELLNLGLPASHAVHAGPLIRWEPPYRNLRRQERRVVFARMMAFLRRCEISYRCFYVDKRFVSSAELLHDHLLQQVVIFLARHVVEFNAYDKLKVYYDNGQSDQNLKKNFLKPIARKRWD